MMQKSTETLHVNYTDHSAAAKQLIYHFTYLLIH